MCLCASSSFQSVTLLFSILNLLCLRVNKNYLHMFCVFRIRFFWHFIFGQRMWIVFHQVAIKTKLYQTCY